MDAVENLDPNSRVIAGQHVNSMDANIGSLGVQKRRDQAISATDVEHARFFRHKARVPTRQHVSSAIEDQLFVQDSEGAYRQRAQEKSLTRSFATVFIATSISGLVVPYSARSEKSWKE
jgi:hypothetical protein